MADEQPNTLSADVTTSDASASEPSSDQSEAQPSKAPSWWNNLFRRRGDPEPEADGSDADGAQTGSAASKTLTLTQEELDRRVQAETDRRESKRANDAKAQQRRNLRDTDPWAYAEEERKAEQSAESDQTMTQFFASIGTEHDKVSIDPLVLSLPQAERDRILKIDGAGRGLEGRKLVVSEAIKSLEKHWKAEGAKDAEARLRRNPAFRKQVLAEARGDTVEPELLPAASSAEADKTVSALLRSHYHLG